MQISDFCELFYASHYMPISCYDRDGVLIKSFTSLENAPDLYFSLLPELFNAKQNPAIFTSALLGTYGIVRLEKTGESIIIGPAFNCIITGDIIRKFMIDNTLPLSRENDVAQFLGSLPQYTHNKFINLLAYLHYCLNGEKIFVADHFSIITGLDKDSKEIATLFTERSYLAKENLYEHGTYNFENQMLDYVRRGDSEQLERFLLSTLNMTHLEEGRLADNPLRQAKNLFIGLVGMVGKEGAIKGGLDIEQTYHLIDTYTRECEKMQNVEDIKTLQYSMLIDFTKRVAESQIPSEISPEVYACIQYIKLHTNENIGLDDVAWHIKKSRAFITRKFKAEIGTTIASFITKTKVEEAANLLTYTDKTLVEISYYLSFSSQSYFQNVFKKEYGVTPAKYRQQMRK